jgi:hypothetical protein
MFAIIYKDLHTVTESFAFLQVTTIPQWAASTVTRVAGTTKFKTMQQMLYIQKAASSVDSIQGSCSSARLAAASCRTP